MSELNNEYILQLYSVEVDYMVNFCRREGAVKVTSVC